MTAQEKKNLSLIKQSLRAIANLDKELDRLCKMQDKVLHYSQRAEWRILSNAISELGEAKSNIEILKNRLKNQIKPTY